MDSEWTDIYTHVSCKTCQDWFGEDHWKDIKAPRELNEWLMSKLNDLRRHIYNKRREILKRQLMDQEKIKKNVTQEDKIEKVIPQQQTLFL